MTYLCVYDLFEERKMKEVESERISFSALHEWADLVEQ